MSNQNLTPLLTFCKRLVSHRLFRLFFEVIGSLTTLLIFSCFILLARLSVGPLNLDFCIPKVEAVLKVPEKGLKASIEHLQLAWRDWEHPFEIELINVHIHKGSNAHWLTIHDAGISLQLPALLAGKIVLKHLRIYQPCILLERENEGSFSLGFDDTALDRDFSFKDVSPFLALGNSSPSLNRFKELTKVSIIEAQVILKDISNAKEWILPKLSFVLNRHVAGSQILCTAPSPDNKGTLSIGLAYKSKQDLLDVTVDFDHISLASLLAKDRPALPYDTFLSILEQWEPPLNGRARLSFSPTTFRVVSGLVNINVGQGTLHSSLHHIPSLPLESGNLHLLFSPTEINLKNISLLSGDMLVHFTGALQSPHNHSLNFTGLLDPGHTLELQGTVEDLPLDNLATLWPQDLAKPARAWLTENLRKGTLTKGTLLFKGHGEDTGLMIDELSGTLVGKNAQLTYLKGLPPIENADAKATFTREGFDIQVLSGKVNKLLLQEGHVLITGLDTDNEALSLVAKIKGPLRDALNVIDHKPLEYASYGGISPDRARGTGSLELRMAFPLLLDLGLKDLKIQLKGSFTDVGLSRKITQDFTADLKSGSFSIDLTQDKMHIKGSGNLNSLPSTLSYSHNFTSSDPHKIQIRVDTTASFADFHRLGFDYEDYAEGDTKAHLIFTCKDGGQKQLAVTLDTTKALLSCPPLDWEKKRGQQGKISFLLHFADDHLTKMDHLEFLSPLYSLQGNVLFDHHNKWKTIHLSQLKGPHTHTAITVHSPHTNVYEISFKGQSLDIEKVRDYMEQDKSNTNYPHTDVKLSATLDQLRLGEGRIFHNIQTTANLILEGNDTHWQAVKLRAEAGHSTADRGESSHISGGIVFDILSGPNKTQTLSVRANDAGQLLKNLSIYDHVQGGSIHIKATRHGHGPYSGRFSLKDFNAHKIPVLARFAAILSPVGIANLFSANENISMERFDCNFTFDDKFVVLQKGIGKSISLGFTVDGRIDREKSAFALKGNVIPARFFNTLLSNIPLVGTLLSGGEGEGIFAMAYTVTGPFSAPNVSVNPLSVLAPGFIRKLFTSPDSD